MRLAHVKTLLGAAAFLASCSSLLPSFVDRKEHLVSPGQSFRAFAAGGPSSGERQQSPDPGTVGTATTSSVPVAVSEELGWHEIPDTQLAPQCPSNPEIQGNTGCASVVLAWNGGVADLKRNRLIVWGGGHSDYFGNEVYALDLVSSKLQRLTEPSPVSNVGSCPESYPDGRPSARHTYNGLVYVPDQDAMFSFGGSRSICGSMSDKIWKLSLDAMNWTLLEPHRGDKILNAPGIASDYDPNTHAVFFSDTAGFFRYDPATNAVKKLADLRGVDDHLTGVIDPGRKLFLMAGYPGQFWAIDIGAHSKHNLQDWSKKVRGCDGLLKVPDPGLAYDPVLHLIVGWAGGDSIFLFDPETRACTDKSYPGGPGPAQRKGSFGRFRYFPSLGVFAVVNDWKQNAFTLRLSETPAAKSPH